MCGEEGCPLLPQQQLWEAHLVGGVDELDTFVGDGQDDGGDLLHVLRGFLQEMGGLSTHLLGASLSRTQRGRAPVAAGGAATRCLASWPPPR